MDHAKFRGQTPDKNTCPKEQLFFWEQAEKEEKSEKSESLKRPEHQPNSVSFRYKSGGGLLF